jgi:uncharacterized protein (TIGR02145 family)
MKKILSIFATLLFTELMFSCAPEAEEGGMFALVEESPGYYYSSSSFRLSSSSTLRSSSSANSFSYGGQTYKTVKIGNQTWMAENLNYAVASTSACYDNLATNCNKYGRLYTWAAAQTACPSGWHLPSQAEWNVLSDYVGGLETEGKHLKAKNGWTDNGNGQDTYGFTALPGGYGYLGGGQFKDVGEYGSWWSSTEDNSDKGNAYSKNMYNTREFAQWDKDEKNYMVSVRCVQD